MKTKPMPSTERHFRSFFIIFLHYLAYSQLEMQPFGRMKMSLCSVSCLIPPEIWIMTRNPILSQPLVGKFVWNMGLKIPSKLFFGCNHPIFQTKTRSNRALEGSDVPGAIFWFWRLFKAHHWSFASASLLTRRSAEMLGVAMINKNTPQ